MITVKLYGLLRLDSGIKERTLEAQTVKDIFTELAKLGIDRKSLDGCAILINGKPGKKRATLQDGDVVRLLPPVAGG